jgi:ribonuclease G
LFDEYGIATAVEAALVPRVPLPKGGSIIIETVAAATVIDVDSGGASPLAVNLAAAREIARQIVLRDLAGAMVIDFIGMKRQEDKARVRAAFTEAMRADADAQLLGWTRLGHFEMTRRRRRASLAELLYESVPGAERAKRPLTIALEALRALWREARAVPGKRLGLRVHPEIAACLDGAARGAVRELEMALGAPIVVVAESRPRDSFALAPV